MARHLIDSNSSGPGLAMSKCNRDVESPLTFTYKEVDGIRVLLDVYLPPDEVDQQFTRQVTRPAVVYFHGGGLTVGNKRSWFPTWLKSQFRSCFKSDPDHNNTYVLMRSPRPVVCTWYHIHKCRLSSYSSRDCIQHSRRCEGCHRLCRRRSECSARSRVG